MSALITSKLQLSSWVRILQTHENINVSGGDREL